MTIELWAGLECTVNRIGNHYYDQIKRTGHEHRLEDLEHFAELGLRRLRYPVLWERTAPDGQPDWRWPDQRLRQLRQLGISPIIGLLHHGSGPAFTNLLDPEFPEKFRCYARAVAERYPWAEAYTPINEPLTTARFSCLYGHWFPHKRENSAFSLAFLLQCKAIILAMREIRSVNPDAQLIQTEDLGKIFSTPKLIYQAQFENCRRWATWDFLMGRVDTQHPMWSFFLNAGIPERELIWFQENSCPPDIIGIDHYVTSDRFLDEGMQYYPASKRGGNGQHEYVDVEAVRVLHSVDLGPRARMLEAWMRYHKPLAITEAHLGCNDPIQQMHWFREFWNTAESLSQSGIPVRAVTSWALLGAFDWNSLLTVDAGYYERGAFELSDNGPKRTPLAYLLEEIACDGHSRLDNRVLEGCGWWRCPERIHYPAKTVNYMV